MAVVYFPGSEHLKQGIERVIAGFDNGGKMVGNGNRNTVKSFLVDGLELNFKLFKRPNPVNKLVYRYFRKSKARRSFENARLLIDRGFFTPMPVAYIEQFSGAGLSDSYYICEQLNNVTEFRRAVLEEDYPQREQVIRYFTGYFYRMHEARIEFLDNSPGNSLVENLPAGQYKIYLVDLNRMNTGKPLSLEQRMKNFSRISEDDKVLSVIADEYALLSGLPATKIQALLRNYTVEFWTRLRNKKKFKKKWKAIKKQLGF